MTDSAEKMRAHKHVTLNADGDIWTAGIDIRENNARMTMIDAVIEELKTHQTQLDQDGVMVGVSRQALEELLAHVAAPAQPAPIAGLEPVASLLDELREYTALRYAGDCKCGNCQLVPRATLDRAIQTMAQLEAHAAEQVRAERRGDNTIQRDKIYRAAERSNTRFGQWMPERWVNIFVEEMSK